MIEAIWNDIIAKMKKEGFTFDTTTDDTFRDRYYTLTLPRLSGDERNSGFAGARHKVTWSVQVSIQYQPSKKPTSELDIARDQERVILALAALLTFKDARVNPVGESKLSVLSFDVMDHIHRS
jgi:hypothetical protein